MKNLTFSADEDLIERARMIARGQKRTLNAAFREWLEEFTAGESDARSFDALMKKLHAVDDGGQFSRDELNERQVLSRHQHLRLFLRPSAPETARKARALIREALTSHQGVVSEQVVQEFFNVALRRFRRPMETHEAEQYLAMVFRPLLAAHSPAALYGEALRLQGHGGLAWYDALIVAGAAQADCAVLLSEDLQHGRRFGSLGVCGWRIRFGTSRPGGLPSSSAGWLVKGAEGRRCGQKLV